MKDEINELTTEELWDLIAAADAMADNNEDYEQADRYTALAEKLRKAVLNKGVQA